MSGITVVEMMAEARANAAGESEPVTVATPAAATPSPSCCKVAAASDAVDAAAATTTAAEEVKHGEASSNVLSLPETKDLFASMDGAARDQVRAANARDLEANLQRATRFVIDSLLPQMVRARAAGQWHLHLQDVRLDATQHLPAATTTDGVVLPVPDLPLVARVLTTVLPSCWMLQMKSTLEAELLCLPETGDQVWVKEKDGTPAVSCRVVQRTAGDVEVMTVEWPWNQLGTVRFHFPSGMARLQPPTLAAAGTAPSSTTAVAAVTASPVRTWASLAQTIPTPQQAAFKPEACFRAALQVAETLVPGFTKADVLRRLLAHRPFLVRDNLGGVFPATLIDIQMTGEVLHQISAEFHFAGYAESKWLPLSSPDIVASLPHRPVGLGQFMMSMVQSATAAFVPGTNKTLKIVSHSPEDANNHTFVVQDETGTLDSKYLTPNTFAHVMQATLRADLTYPLVCGLAPTALVRMFRQGALYTYTECA